MIQKLLGKNTGEAEMGNTWETLGLFREISVIWMCWNQVMFWYYLILFLFNIDLINMKHCIPASSEWPFDHPNGGHLSPEKVT